MAFAVHLLFAVLAQVSAAGAAPAVRPPPVTAAPVTLTLRLADQRRQFRPGEAIPVELEFTSATTGRYSVDGATYDRSGRLTIDEFVIDRIDEVSDPLLDFFGSGGGIGGGIRGIGVLGEKPYTVKLELNDWFRFDTPGTYTLAVKSRRVTDESIRPSVVIPVESNPVSFEILPRSEAWEAAQLETARRLVEAQPFQDARAGCRMLRYLGTEDAAMVMIRRFGADPNQGCEFDFMAGLFTVANRAAVVRAMEAGLRAADQPVTYSYLRALAMLSVYLQHPELRPAQTRETKGRFAPAEESSRPREAIDAAMSAYGDVVTAACPGRHAGGSAGVDAASVGVTIGIGIGQEPAHRCVSRSPGRASSHAARAPMAHRQRTGDASRAAPARLRLSRRRPDGPRPRAPAARAARAGRGAPVASPRDSGATTGCDGEDPGQPAGRRAPQPG